MKLRFFPILAILAISGSVVAWSTLAENSSESPDDRVEAMDRASAEIAREVKAASMLELELENGVDPVATLEEDGFILDVTLDEAKAALDAALATPDKQDDQRALELIHRGSFRFYLDVPEN